MDNEWRLGGPVTSSKESWHGRMEKQASMSSLRPRHVAYPGSDGTRFSSGKL